MKLGCLRPLFVYITLLLLILFQTQIVSAADTPSTIKRTQPIEVGVEREADADNQTDIHSSEMKMSIHSVKRVSERPEEVSYELRWSVFIRTDTGLRLTPTVSMPYTDDVRILSEYEVYVPETTNSGTTLNFTYILEIRAVEGNMSFLCGVDVRRA